MSSTIGSPDFALLLRWWSHRRIFPELMDNYTHRTALTVAELDIKSCLEKVANQMTKPSHNYSGEQDRLIAPSRSLS